MKLSADELERYARHIVLRDVGGAGQQKLKAARVLIVGAGGLGSPMLQYLAAAGIGTIGVVDDDVVSLSNLQRQIIHDTEMIGRLKVDSAKAAIFRINPHVTVEAWPVRLTAANAHALLTQYEIVADGSDNFETRYLVADICEELEIPLITGAVGQFDGSISTIKAHETDGAGNQNPGYRDLFPEQPPEGLLPTCAEAGILGALTGIIGCMQALEIIKEITGVGDGLAGRLLLFDSRSTQFQEVKYRRDSKIDNS